MSDAVFDTSVVAIANKDIARRKLGNSIDQKLCLLERAVGGQIRIRYNWKLLTEYKQIVTDQRNDVIESFFQILDSMLAVRVARSTLSRQHFQRAIAQRWPRHDQHLLAAALDGDRTCLYVTEVRLAKCAAGIYRVFRIRVCCV